MLIEGASHFSPVRVEGQIDQDRGDDLLQLGEALVGVQPLSVQALLSKEIIKFLDGFEDGQVGPSIHKQEGDLRIHILDRAGVSKLLRSQ